MTKINNSSTCCIHYEPKKEPLHGCVLDIVKHINKLQLEAINTKTCDNNCTKPYLGSTGLVNTRPIILYTESGAPFELAYFNEVGIIPAPIFRVEDVKGNCAVLRALGVISHKKPCEEDVSNNYQTIPCHLLVPTNQCCTVDLTRFIGIQCLDDIHLQLHHHSCR
ncbi:MAG TPA: spore coat protein [Firmicutes bacterium]|nr:spore coat protein [Bacillota bacterium]